MPNKNIGSKISNSKSIVSKPGKDGIVLGDDEAKEIFKPASPDELPDVKKIISKVEEIMVYMCNDDVLDLKLENNDAYKEMMESKFKDFNDLYPSLFSLIIDGKDISMMLEMMTRIEKVKNNELSMNDAQEQLKDKLSEQYVYSKMTKAKAESLKNEVKNIEKSTK